MDYASYTEPTVGSQVVAVHHPKVIKLPLKSLNSYGRFRDCKKAIVSDFFCHPSSLSAPFALYPFATRVRW